MTIKTKRVGIRVKDNDLSKWLKRAKKYKVSLTEYLTTKANDDHNDKNLFI